MKHISILTIAIVVLTIGYYLTEPSLKDNNAVDTTPSSHNPSNTQPTLTNPHNQSSPSVNANTATTPSAANIPAGKTGNPHFDQLSPEMQQALKEQLLLEGPMEAITHPDGSIELPANGRFTQMPVAVEMPDGSIVIREYSQIPKNK